MIPYEKMSKKEQRKQDARRRRYFPAGCAPRTEVPKTVYSRSRERRGLYRERHRES